VTDGHAALAEPTGSLQQIAYVRARQQGHLRSFAAGYAQISEDEAHEIDREWGFSLTPETHHQEGA
jgi:hypothetical protein